MKTRLFVLCLVAMIFAACQKDELPARYGSPASPSSWNALNITSGTWFVTKTYLKDPEGYYSDRVLGGSGPQYYRFDPNGTCERETRTPEGKLVMKEQYNWSYKVFSSTLVIGDELYSVRILDGDILFLVDQLQSWMFKLEQL